MYTIRKTISIVVFVCVYVSSSHDTGHPSGLWGDCPGMTKNTSLSDATRRSLVIVAVKRSPETVLTDERTCQLSAEGAKCVAKFFDLKHKKTQEATVFLSDLGYSLSQNSYGNTEINVSRTAGVRLYSGYMDASFSPLMRSLVNPYLDIGRNVIILEIFPVLVRTYPLAARITRPLGKMLGEFLVELTNLGMSPKRLELTGGSLGAHIASYASDRYWELTGLRPARLSALDPAGPCFRNLPPSERLHPQAALKVDALHTNIDGFGIADPLAQIDFYANGGEFQPWMISDFIMPCFLLCSHVRSALYWLQACRNPDKFIAVKCNSVADARRGDCYNDTLVTNVLGPNTDFSKPGVYYLPTNEASPFYKGIEGLKSQTYRFNDFLTKAAPEEDMIL